jgi:hypothetical protein
MDIEKPEHHWSCGCEYCRQLVKEEPKLDEIVDEIAEISERMRR